MEQGISRLAAVVQIGCCRVAVGTQLAGAKDAAKPADHFLLEAVAVDGDGTPGHTPAINQDAPQVALLQCIDQAFQAADARQGGCDVGHRRVGQMVAGEVEACGGDGQGFSAAQGRQQADRVAGDVADARVIPPVKPAREGDQAGGGAVSVARVACGNNMRELACAPVEDDVLGAGVGLINAGGDDAVVDGSYAIDLDGGGGVVAGLFAIGQGCGAGVLGDFDGLAVDDGVYGAVRAARAIAGISNSTGDNARTGIFSHTGSSRAGQGASGNDSIPVQRQHRPCAICIDAVDFFALVKTGVGSLRQTRCRHFDFGGRNAACEVNRNLVAIAKINIGDAAHFVGLRRGHSTYIAQVLSRKGGFDIGDHVRRHSACGACTGARLRAPVVARCGVAQSDRQVVCIRIERVCAQAGQ